MRFRRARLFPVSEVLRCPGLTFVCRQPAYCWPWPDMGSPSTGSRSRAIPEVRGRYMVTRAGGGRLRLGTLLLDSAVCGLGEPVLTLQYFGVGRSYGDAAT